MTLQCILIFALVILNLIFTIIGFVAIIIGIVLVAAISPLADSLKDYPLSEDLIGYAPKIVVGAALFILITGILICVFGLVGICGTLKENKPLLAVYIISMFALLCVEIGGGAYLMAKGIAVKNDLEKYLLDDIRNNYNGTRTRDSGQIVLATNINSLAWDALHYKLKCCGLRGYHDFDDAQEWSPRTTTYRNNVTNSLVTVNETLIPLTCCKVSNPEAFPTRFRELMFVDIGGCVTGPTSSNAYMDGCYDTLKAKLVMNKDRFATVISVIYGVQVFCMVAAMLLYCWSKKEESDK